MKAVRLLEFGGQLLFDDVPAPAIARDEILVKIKSTAVNHLDLVKASGTARQILPIDLPWIPGHEFSGIVEQTGSDVGKRLPGSHLDLSTSLESQAAPPCLVVNREHTAATQKN